MIELTEEEFKIIYDALKLVNDPFSDAEIEEVIIAELEAWKAIQDADRRYNADPS